MLVLTALQSIVFLVITLAVVFFAARVIVAGEKRYMARAAARRVSLAHLMAEPEPEAAPRAHLRLVHSAPGQPADEPYDQMKELAL